MAEIPHVEFVPPVVFYLSGGQKAMSILETLDECGVILGSRLFEIMKA